MVYVLLNICNKGLIDNMIFLTVKTILLNMFCIVFTPYVAVYMVTDVLMGKDLPVILSRNHKHVVCSSLTNKITIT